MEKGCIQVYTGDGKGKTTAAIGLTIRALGAGLSVYFAQFMKVPSSSEHRILQQFAPQLTLRTWGKPCFIARRAVSYTHLDVYKRQAHRRLAERLSDPRRSKIHAGVLPVCGS